MGQKVDPRGMRIGIVKTWDSKWFAKKGKEYLNNFHEDLKIREYIKKNYYQAGISSIAIERVSDRELTVIISTGKAAVLIGRKGAEITALKGQLEKMTGKKVFVKALEIKNPNKDAQLVAESIATAIEKRVAYKRAVQQAIQRAEKAGVLGIKVMTSGRLNGAEIARSEWTLSGRVPLHTLRADVDYATATAHTTYGALGIKVWIFNGEVLPSKKEGGDQ
ncbi:30S ribosomal protein S3 [Pseudostreptobacillus hongkongensis]|uniref:30S ribosomal protein S3 n=1 Tax=Pseudostreptobacillus hongkongensis TaxID=1162717 RepID=UPI000834911A|nr:30S ribosomal protein S3 [Pseudostreptobacillus hongkongensis]